MKAREIASDLDKQAWRKEGRHPTKNLLVKLWLANAGHLQPGERYVASSEGEQSKGEGVGGGREHSKPTLQRTEQKRKRRRQW